MVSLDKEFDFYIPRSEITRSWKTDFKQLKILTESKIRENQQSSHRLVRDYESIPLKTSNISKFLKSIGFTILVKEVNSYYSKQHRENDFDVIAFNELMRLFICIKTREKSIIKRKLDYIKEMRSLLREREFIIFCNSLDELRRKIIRCERICLNEFGYKNT